MLDSVISFAKAAQVVRHCYEKLSAYAILSSVVDVKSCAQTPFGKVDFSERNLDMRLVKSL